MNSQQSIVNGQLLTGGGPGLLDGLVLGDEEVSRWAQWVDAYAMWLEQKRQRSGSGNTARAYRVAFGQCFGQALDAEGLVLWQPVKPWEMDSRTAVAWAGFLAKFGKELRARWRRGAVIGREPLAAASVGQKVAAMASFYQFAQRQAGLWPAERRNPFEAVERSVQSMYGRASYPEFEEAQAILGQINTSTLTGKRDLALLYAILTTCRRSSEVLGLRWGDLRPVEDGWAFSYRYKGGKIKRAVLGDKAYQLICQYLRADGRLETMRESDYIFIALDEERIRRMRPEVAVQVNRPLSNSMANRILKKYARRAGVASEKAHIHGLRHAGARQRVKEMKKTGKVDYEEIMDVLGHSNLAVTQVYVRSVAEDPADNGLAAAEDAWLPKGARRRRVKKSAGEQMGF